MNYRQTQCYLEMYEAIRQGDPTTADWAEWLNQLSAS